MNDDERLKKATDSLNWAIGVVGDAANEPDLTVDQQNELTAQFQTLRDVREKLVLDNLDQSLDRLKASSNRLEQITKGINQTSDQLRKIAEHVATAAKVLGIAASVAAKAASSGIV